MLALSAGTLMASAGTSYQLVPAHFYPCLIYVCVQATMGLLSSKFSAELQRANEELELARQTLTADITRMTRV